MNFIALRYQIMYTNTVYCALQFKSLWSVRI